MSDIESAKAAREARESARERAASGHTTEELADCAIRLHLLTEELEREKAEKHGDAKEKEGEQT